MKLCYIYYYYLSVIIFHIECQLEKHYISRSSIT